MRAARIYSENTKNIFLYVNVIIVGSSVDAFNFPLSARLYEHSGLKDTSEKL